MASVESTRVVNIFSKRMKFTGFILVCVLAVCSAQVWGAEKKSSPKEKAPSKKSYTIAKDPYIGAIVVDGNSGRILFQDHADTKAYPASTLKLMDLLIVLEKLERKELTLQDPVPVSAKASVAGGSQVWLAEKEVFPLEDMLYALMIQSANDAATAIAEKVGGSTEGFVQLMNQKAQAIGMSNTRFNSVHGLPPARGQEDDVTTARDMAKLCMQLVKRPETFNYTSAKERNFRTNNPKRMVVMRTHNHLLSRVNGCDGLKTGYIAKAGFSIAVTAARNGQRVVVVVLGSPDLKTRDARASELVEKGFAALNASTTSK